jgi:hypothetical protein
MDEYYNISTLVYQTEFERAIIFDRRSLDSKLHDIPTIDAEKALLYVV